MRGKDRAPPLRRVGQFYVFTIRGGKFAVAQRADRGVRPYRTLCVFALTRAILQLRAAGRGKPIPYVTAKHEVRLETAKMAKKNRAAFAARFSVLALPIFPVSHPTSIFGGNELNFCVRYGNRWTLIPISTNYSICCALKTGHHETAFLRDTSEPAYYCRSSPRLISISQLNTLLCLHP